MTREEAIQILKEVVNRDCCAGNTGRLEYDALDIAITDMRRNVPMTPKYVQRFDDESCYVVCPICRKKSMASDYCPFCGQAIKDGDA